MHHPTDRITHTTAFVTPVVEHWLEREIAQWVHPMKDRSDDPPHHERTLYVPLPGGAMFKSSVIWLLLLLETYLGVHILLCFGHACSRAQPLAWPVTVSAAGGKVVGG